MTNYLRRIKTDLLILIIGLYTIPINAHPFFQEGLRHSARPADNEEHLDFQVRTYNMAADSLRQNRLSVQLGVSNAQIQFIKEKDFFKADLRIKLALTDSAGSEIKTDDWVETVFAENFQETVEPSKINSVGEDYIVPPGHYELIITVEDLETNKTGEAQKKLFLNSFDGDSLKISDILFVNSVAFLTGEVKEREENRDDSLFVYYEVYNVAQGDTLAVEYAISDKKKTVRGKKQIVADGRVVRDFVPTPLDSIQEKEMQVLLSVRNGAEKKSVKASLNATSGGSDPVLENLDEAVEALLHIISKKQYRKMKSLQGEEKLAAFKQFWKERDRTPEMPENEFMSVYYARVALANKEFTDFLPGWRTPMGLVLIKLGQPDYVEYGERSKSYYDNYLDKPLMIWRYNRHNRYVVFKFRGSGYQIENYGEVFHLLSGDDIEF